MRYSGVGTRELSQREMEYNLKMAQDYRQQLELKLENLKLKRARVWQEGQLIEEERAASVGAYETEPEGAVVVESEVEALGSLSSAQPVEGFVESESGFWLDESSQSESASGKDVHDAQGQQIVPSADPVRDGCRGAELMTTISTTGSPVIIVTDLEHKSRDQHNEVSFPPWAGGVALSFQPAARDHAMQWEGADEETVAECHLAVQKAQGYKSAIDPRAMCHGMPTGVADRCFFMLETPARTRAKFTQTEITASQSVPALSSEMKRAAQFHSRLNAGSISPCMHFIVKDIIDEFADNGPHVTSLRQAVNRHQQRRLMLALEESGLQVEKIRRKFRTCSSATARAVFDVPFSEYVIVYLVASCLSLLAFGAEVASRRYSLARRLQATLSSTFIRNH
ncbi:hypothetical protein HPB49_012155 [Dermacentor silvarum]|uniref:Uncharacterized protein n=1 Tax=Dermacentor silvarum TaxID=543639 RepID=A0ACB8CR53_DERSI|nr:hypothetical protein HPB49_012155 [Dermacentor silvarum]